MTLPSGLSHLTHLELSENEQLTDLTFPPDITNVISIGLTHDYALKSVTLPYVLLDGYVGKSVTYAESDLGTVIQILLSDLSLTATLSHETGGVELLLTGPPGTYMIQASDDILDTLSWADEFLVDVPESGSVQISDPEAKSRSHRNYRAQLWR